MVPQEGRQFFSFDLRAATDRFPMCLQRVVVRHLLGDKFEKAWYRLMVGMKFSCKGKLISYGAGQPMGAYTSWAVFALCHHLLVRVAGHNVFKTYTFDQYR